MLATAKNWGYSSVEIALRKLVLPERNVHVPAHFTRSQVESILSLANEPWRTFFIVLALTGLRAGEALGLQWPDIDFHHKCIHVRRSAWYGKAQSTKSKASAAPVTLPDALANVLRQYHSIWTANLEGWLFATRNNRPPSSNNVVEYRLWPILDRLDIPRCGFSALHCVLHRGRGLLARSRKTTAPPYRRPHNAQLYSFARRNHRTGDGGRFKFPEVGRSWTRTREGKPVYSIACRA